jgi:hypothetical protein
MDEFKKIIRYIIPGVVCVIETILYVFVWHHFSGNKVHIPNIGTGFIRIDSVSFTIVILGFGALLSIIYHCIFNSKFFARFGVNYMNFLEQCVKRGWIELVWIRSGDKASLGDISHIGTWRIFNAYWHLLRGRSSELRRIEEASKNISDVERGMGAMLVGSWVSFILGVFYCCNFSVSNQDWIVSAMVIIISILFIVMHYIVSRRAVETVLASDTVGFVAALNQLGYCGGNILVISVPEEARRFVQK